MSDYIHHISKMITEDASILTEWEGVGTGESWITPDDIYRTGEGVLAFIYTSEGEIYYGLTIAWDTHGKLIGRKQELSNRYAQLWSADAIDQFEKNFDLLSSDEQPEPDIVDLDPKILQQIQADMNPQQPQLNEDKCPNCGNQIESGGELCDDCLDEMSGEDEYDEYFDSNGMGWRKETEDIDLLGRIDKDKSLVSFWNRNEEILQKLLKPCLARLIKDGKLKPDAYVSTPIHGTIHISELENTKVKELSPEEIERIELYQQLHLMKPAEKKATMIRLGLLDPEQGVIKRPWQREAEQVGMVQPGQKWWAPTSEDNIEAIAKTITEDIDLVEWENEYDEGELDFPKPDPKYTYRNLNPDTLWDKAGYKAESFIYGHGQLYLGGSQFSHWKLIDSVPEMRGGRRIKLEEEYCFGRAGPVDGEHYVSFWNYDTPEAEQMLKSKLNECLEALLEAKVVKPETIVIVYGMSNMTIEQALSGEVGTERISDEERQKLELYKQLHLMKPAEKKAAMIELGLLDPSQGVAKRPWQKEAETVGMVQPGQKWWAPTSESNIDLIARVIAEDIDLVEWEEPEDEADEEDYTGDEADEWIDPNTLYDSGRDLIPFIFRNGEIFYGNNHEDTHTDIYGAIGASSKGRERDIRGRVGHYDGNHIVSFWNEFKPSEKVRDYELPAGTLAELQLCLDRLLADQVITQDTFISTPTHGTVKLDNLVPSKNPVDSETVELYQQLHLMKPAEKKAAMIKLGLLNPNQVVKSPWQKEAETVGMVQPGQKWWAPTSETIDSIAKLITEDPNVIVESDVEDTDRSARRWFDPNTLCKGGNVVPFVYTLDGQMHYGKWNDFHADILDKLQQTKLSRGALSDFKDDSEKINLHGRVSILGVSLPDLQIDGQYMQIVGFWPSRNEGKLLEPCLRRLIDDDVIDMDTLVSTFKLGTVELSSLFAE